MRGPGIPSTPKMHTHMWDFPKIRVPYLGVLIISILLFRVLYLGPLFSETPIFSSWRRAWSASRAWEGCSQGSSVSFGPRRRGLGLRVYDLGFR